MTVKKINSDELIIKPEEKVTVTTMGNTTEICYLSNRNDSAPIVKLSKDTYYDTNSGKVKEFQHSAENRKDTPAALRHTFRRIRQLVLTNVIDVKCVRWCTLTYAVNMRDPHQLYEDFRRFNQRFQYYCKKNGYDKAEYIAVAEPQLRGAWHLHVLYIWPQNAPYIANDVFEAIWGHGFTSVKALKDTGNNIAGYLTAYLSDMKIPDKNADFCSDNRLKIVTVNGKKKAIIKGARLHMYPNGFNILRCSQGIKQPGRETMSYMDALKRVSDKTLKYRSTVLMSEKRKGRNFQTIIDKQEYR